MFKDTLCRTSHPPPDVQSCQLVVLSCSLFPGERHPTLAHNAGAAVVTWRTESGADVTN